MMMLMILFPILESPDVDKRMEICDDLIDHLMYEHIVDDYTLDDIADQIKDFTII